MRNLLLLVFIFTGIPVCFADVSTEPDTCIITIQSVQLKNRQGEWIKIIEPDKQVDIANYEARVSFFNRDGRIPDGEYVNVKVVLSEWVRVSGRVDQSGDPNFTKRDGVVRVVGSASQSGSLPGTIKRLEEKPATWTNHEEEAGEIKVHLDLDNGDEDETFDVTALADFEKPFKIEKNSQIIVLMRLDLKNSLRYAWQDDYGPGVPSRSVVYFMPQKGPEMVRIRIGEETTELDQQRVKLVF